MINQNAMAQVAKAMGLNLDEEEISIMTQLLENGVSAEGMIKIIETLKTEIKEYNKQH